MKVSAIVLAAAGLLLLPVASVSAEGINDAQIASIVVTANQVDIDAGRLAAARATSEEVKTFARLMVTDHTGVNKAATDLAAKIKVIPQNNRTAGDIASAGPEQHWDAEQKTRHRRSGPPRGRNSRRIGSCESVA